MTDMPRRGWDELLTLVRNCERGEPLPESEQQAALELAAQVARSTLTGAVGCSITVLRPDGSFVTPAAAGEVAQILDYVQYAEDDGPCVRAARTGKPQRLDAMALDQRWPTFVQRAAENGVTSSLSLPLLSAQSPAALNLYAAAEDAFASTRSTAVAHLLAKATATLLMDVGGLPVEGLSVARVQRAISERTLITRAQGVVMAQHGLNAHQAYRLMAVRSGDDSLSLMDVAQGVLDEAETASGEDVSA